MRLVRLIDASRFAQGLNIADMESIVQTLGLMNEIAREKQRFLGNR